MKTLSQKGLFELMEADNGGVRDLSCGYMSNKAQADRWVNKSLGYRSARPAEVNIVIFDTLEELEDHARSVIAATAFARLSTAEKQALIMEIRSGNLTA